VNLLFTNIFQFAEAESSSNGDSPVHIDAPAGLSFQHIRPTNGLCGTGQGYQFVDLSSLSSGMNKTTDILS